MQFKLPGFSLTFTESSSRFFDSKLKSKIAHFSGCHTVLQNKIKAKTIGFFDWPIDISHSEVDKLAKISKRLRKDFKGTLICGIGGSHLGAAAILQALQSPEQEAEHPLFWLNNVDPYAVERAQKFVSNQDRALLTISKSGNTTETLAGLFKLAHHCKKEGWIFITDPASGELRRLAKALDIETLNVPSNIGGRFSVLTSVGLLPCQLAGIDTVKLIEGARQMRECLIKCEPQKNPAYLYAGIKYIFDTETKHSHHYLMPYHSNLQLLGDWYVQLWAESLGKKQSDGKSVGPTFSAALGTRDQHSLLQLFKEGPPNKLIGFLDFESGTETLIGRPPFEAKEFDYMHNVSFEKLTREALKATQKSLEMSSVPTYRFTLDRLDAQTLGAFLFFHETACAFAGELYGIDAFNQPGVEESKRLLRQSL